MWQAVISLLSKITFKHVLALSVIHFCFIVILIVLLVKLPDSADKYVGQIITACIGLAGTVIAFWYTASNSEARKDETIRTLSNTTPPGNTTTNTTSTSTTNSTSNNS